MRPMKARFVVMLVALVALAALVIGGSASIGVMDQGDHSRTVSRIVGEPLPPTADDAPGAPDTRWSFAGGLPHPNPSSGTPSFLFAGAALVQSSYQDHFDLMQLGLAAKVLWAMSLALLAAAVGRRVALPHSLGVLLAGALLLVSFAAHNVAFLQSLYGEFSFLLGLPVLLSALLWPDGRTRWLLLFAGLVLCGGAKAQFFYVPALLLTVVWIEARSRGAKVRGPTLAVILVAQLLCFAPLLASDVMDFNRHHSTYQGSYLAMTEAERDRLGLDRAERACIGVDAWGNRLAALDATRATPGETPCPGARKKTLLDTLRPYAVAPVIAFRLLGTGLPPHMTVNYFHVDQRNRYLVELSRETGPIAQVLQGLTHVRDRVVSPWGALFVVAAAMALSGLTWRRSDVIWPITLFLSLLFASQVAVSLLGEGVRDLSKHLAGAQYGLDLLILLLGCQVVVLLRNRGSATSSTAS